MHRFYYCLSWVLSCALSCKNEGLWDFIGFVPESPFLLLLLGFRPKPDFYGSAGFANHRKRRWIEWVQTSKFYNFSNLDFLHNSVCFGFVFAHVIKMIDYLDNDDKVHLWIKVKSYLPIYEKYYKIPNYIFENETIEIRDCENRLDTTLEGKLCNFLHRQCNICRKRRTKSGGFLKLGFLAKEGRREGGQD